MTDLGAIGRFVDPEFREQLQRVEPPRKALFLDRDGVVNVDRNYVHSASETEWVPGIFDLARDAVASGFLLIIVTNQAGIARGLYDEAGFREYTAWVHRQFADRAVPLLATFFCPHHPSAGRGSYGRECLCRKPAPGMILAANEAFELDLASSALVGDKDSDIEAAAAAGVGRRVLLRTGEPMPTLDQVFPTEEQ